jgi:hypothetical protein
VLESADLVQLVIGLDLRKLKERHQNLHNPASTAYTIAIQAGKTHIPSPPNGGTQGGAPKGVTGIR